MSVFFQQLSVTLNISFNSSTYFCGDSLQEAPERQKMHILCATEFNRVPFLILGSVELQSSAAAHSTLLEVYVVIQITFELQTSDPLASSHLGHEPLKTH